MYRTIGYNKNEDVNVNNGTFNQKIHLLNTMIDDVTTHKHDGEADIMNNNINFNVEINPGKLQLLNHFSFSFIPDVGSTKRLTYEHTTDFWELNRIIEIPANAKTHVFNDYNFVDQQYQETGNYYCILVLTEHIRWTSTSDYFKLILYGGVYAGLYTLDSITTTNTGIDSDYQTHTWVGAFLKFTVGNATETNKYLLTTRFSQNNNSNNNHGMRNQLVYLV